MISKKYQIIVFSKLVLFSLFTFIHIAHGQLFSKSYAIAGNGLKCQQSRLLADGNLLLAGTKSPSTQDYAIYLLKLNPLTGDTIWSKSFNITHKLIKNISADELTNGDIVVAANIKDSVSTIDTEKLFIVSVNNFGNLNWSKYYHYPVAYPIFRAPCIKKLAHNNFLVCSTSEDTLGVSILKMNNAGDTLFSKSFFFDSVVVSGGYVISDILEVNNGFVFTGSIEYGINQLHLLLFKTDTFGNMQWFKSDYFSLVLGFDVGSNLTGQNLLLANDSNIVVGISSGAGLMKVSSSGNLIWLKMINDTASYYTPPQYGTITKANDGGYLLAGFTDYADMTGGTFSAIGKQFIVKFDSAANIVWSKKYMFEKNFNNCSFITQLLTGNILCAGTVFDTVVTTNVSNSKMYLMRLDSAGTSAGLSCGLDSNFSIYPYTLPISFYNKSYKHFNGYGSIPVSLNQVNERVAVNNIPLLLSVEIFGFPNSSICQGSAITFTAENTNGGSTTNFNFLVNGVSAQYGTSNIFNTSSLVFPDTVKCIMTGNALCLSSDTAISNSIVPPIYPSSTPNVTIAASPSGVITPGTLVTFTATVVNGGPTPNYLWKKNGTAITTFPTYTSATLVNGDVIVCDVTGNSLCAALPTGESNSLNIITTAAGLPLLNYSTLCSISPNPASTEVTINHSFKSLVLLKLLDVCGRELLSKQLLQSTETLDISTLPQGLYFVQINALENKIVSKLLINR